MVEVWWQHRATNTSDELLWSSDGENNNKIYDIVWNETGGRTDTLEFKCVRSYNPNAGNLNIPSLDRIIYIKDKDGTCFPFSVVESKENLYGEWTIYCASSGYQLKLSKMVMTESQFSQNFYKRYADQHLWSLWNYVITQRQNSGNPWNPPALYQSHTGLPQVEFFERKDVLGNACSESADRIISECNILMCRRYASYNSTSKTWQEKYIVGNPDALRDDANISNYEISSYEAISNFEKKRSLDDFYNISWVIGSDLITLFGRGTNRKIGNQEKVVILDTCDYDEIVETANNLYGQLRHDNGSITTKIDVNPIICEPGDRRIRIFDCLHFVGVPPVTGWYMVKSIKRYIDNPSQTKFELVSVDAPAESDDRVYVKW